MRYLSVIYIFTALFICVATYPITYEDVRGRPYNVSYDHRAITINGVRTMLISGAIHYPRSTPAMWPYIMQMAKKQGLNTIQTYVFWNLHEQKQGVLDFSGRANLSRFLQEAANAGLFVNLRLGPYVCAEWDYGGLPAWLNQISNISFRSNNDAWKREMRQFLLSIMDYVTPYLAKNGGPIILAQIENELHGNDMDYLNWCDSLVTNEFASAEVPWIMCNGLAANSTIETCNNCNCFPTWIDNHLAKYPTQPLMFTENEGWFQPWGEALAIRTTANLAYSVATWFAAGGAYHAYYMWHGGNNYGRTAGAGVTTLYADDVCLHADGTPNEPKYTHLSRLQHLIAQHAESILSKDPNRTVLPRWDGQKWVQGPNQYLYSYPSSIHFVINQHDGPVMVLYNNQNITLTNSSLQIYDDNMVLLWESNVYSDIPSNNTEIVPIIVGPLQWQTWSESSKIINLPVVSALGPLEQLTVTNDETIYLWYRRNVTLQRVSATSMIRVQTRIANALLFFLDGQFLGEFDDHQHSGGSIDTTLTVDISHFQTDHQYLLEILSVSLGLDNNVSPNRYEQKGIVGNIWIDGQLLFDNQTETNFWQHQKGLIGEYLQIYTEQGSSKVKWNAQWTQGINQPVTWFQARFDLDHLVQQDLNANPILFDAQGLNGGHAFINGNDLGLYWLIQGICSDSPPCCCQQAQINCLKPSQRYYHIPSDWLMVKNNLLTVFDDLDAPNPGSVGFVQRVVQHA